jgi:hypothetical protein
VAGVLGLLLILPPLGTGPADALGVAVSGSLVLAAVPVVLAPVAGVVTLGALPLLVAAPVAVALAPVILAPALVAFAALLPG